MSRLIWGVLLWCCCTGGRAALPGQLPPIPEMPDTFRKEAGVWVENRPITEADCAAAMAEGRKFARSQQPPH